LERRPWPKSTFDKVLFGGEHTYQSNSEDIRKKTFGTFGIFFFFK
jgi:hypothetical protein